MRVLITGVSGFGGSGMARRLLKKGYAVRGIDLVAPSHSLSLKDVVDQVDYRWKSLLDIQREDVEGCDIILHFAAQADVPMGFTSPSWTIANNVLGTVAVLEAARKQPLQKLLLASSANAVQYTTVYPITEGHPPSPRNPYGASKGAQELLAWAWYRSYGVPIVIYRNGIIYGPGMRREIFIYKWLHAILRGEPIVVEGGQQTRDPTYVSDTADAWMLGVEAEPEKVVGEVFQVSSGREYTVLEIALKCMEACGRTVALEKAPYRPGEEGMRECFNISKAEKVLGYDPKVTLEEGLSRTVDWMKGTGRI